MFKSPFLVIQTSFWPILLSFSIFSLLTNFVFYFNCKITLLLPLLSFLTVLLIMFLWWKDFSRESVIGFHTHKLEVSLRVAMLLFILSEVFFFLSFFWAFFDASLSPTVDVGMVWPPKGIEPLSFYSVPLLNTIILVTSGVTVTWAHHAIMANSFSRSFVSLLITVLLGVYFLCMQWLEYAEAPFAMADSIYGSTFFMATGFHGMHVLIGTCFLFYVLVLLSQGKLIYNHHFSFEAAAWYWHFVDVVWLFLFISIYWWGSLC
uniref:Cytochrome c oxidase subunit 3 n=1 Tax=Proales similis TaxID=360698 RepID=A0A7D4WWU1_9BILA|nr:cytochrome c oxidase subunit III [Proales similis]